MHEEDDAAIATACLVKVHRDAAADIGVFSFGNCFYDHASNLGVERVLAHGRELVQRPVNPSRRVIPWRGGTLL